MDNFHNLRSLTPSVENRNDRLWLVLAVAALLIGGELLWNQISNAGYEIDGYSANLSVSVLNRDIREAIKLGAEASSVDLGGDIENDFRAIDYDIESSL